MKKIISCILALTSLATATVALSACDNDKEYYTYRVYEWKENPTDEDYDEYGRGPIRLDFNSYSNTSLGSGTIIISDYDPSLLGGTKSPGVVYNVSVQNRWVDVEGTLYNANGTTTEIEKAQREIVAGDFSYIGGIALDENKPTETTFTSLHKKSDTPDNRIAVKIGEYDVFVQWNNLVYNLYKYFNCDTTEISLLTYEAPNINGIEKMPSYTEMKITGTKDGQEVDVELRINESDRYVHGQKNTCGCVEKFRYLVGGVGYDLTFSNYEYTEADGYANRNWMYVGGGDHNNKIPFYDFNILETPTKITVNGKQENVPVNNVEASNIYLDKNANGTCSIGTAYNFIYYYDVDEFIFKIDSVKTVAKALTTNPNITVKIDEDMFTENGLIVYELEIKTTVKGQGTSTQYTRFGFDPMTGLIKEFINKADDNGTVKETNLTVAYEWEEEK